MTTARLGPTDNPPRVKLGDLTITILDGGQLWLDGGAMFGIIPKPLWSRLVEVDEANRIPLAMTCCLVETAGRRVLIETGAGVRAKYSEKEQGFFRLGEYWILDSLQAVGVERESIDFVIVTHLHFDHAGGGTMPKASDGAGYVVTFPNARYVVQRGEWEDATGGQAVMTGTYRPENLAPLEEAGVLSLVSGDAEIVPGVSVRRMPGHTPHHQGVVLESGDRRAVQPGDTMPTAAHVGLRHNMAYDLLPIDNMRSKEQLLRGGRDRSWRLLLGQDPGRVLWDIREDDRGRFSLLPGA
jgi:glyoxylase-like metal-dependent hydrolase (beta-lactamase superfamily II)